MLIRRLQGPDAVAQSRIARTHRLRRAAGRRAIARRARAILAPARRCFAACRLPVPVMLLVALRALALAGVARARPEDRVHDHRQFADDERSPSPLPAARRIPSSSSWSSAGVRTGSRRRAAAACAATCCVISGHFDGGTEFYTDRLDAREYLPVDELERVVVQRLVPGPVLAAEGGLSLRLQHAERRADAQRVRRNRAQPRALRAFARRCRAARPRAGRAPRREQSRPHAPHLQGRAGDLRLSSRRRSGATAGPLLERYFQSAPAARSASGRASPKLLAAVRAERA